MGWGRLELLGVCFPWFGVWVGGGGGGWGRRGGGPGGGGGGGGGGGWVGCGGGWGWGGGGGVGGEVGGGGGEFPVVTKQKSSRPRCGPALLVWPTAKQKKRLEKKKCSQDEPVGPNGWEEMVQIPSGTGNGAQCL